MLEYVKNLDDKDNFTPLLIAACNGHADTIHTLLDLGARIEDVDKNDKSALYWAAEEDNVVALKVRPSMSRRMHAHVT